MKGIKCAELCDNPGFISLREIPFLDYSVFFTQTVSLLSREVYHCLNYFTVADASFIDFFILIANDESHKILVYAHRQSADIKELDSISREAFQLHIFEREISETSGITFKDHPWPKPLRYPSDRFDGSAGMNDYPFYAIDGGETHEVGVGPIHAGVIEPGHFRFVCYGEKVLHLEIQLGYQHRGVEALFLKNHGMLHRSILSENIAGDTAIGHSVAFAQLAESLSAIEVSKNLEAERIIALELERMAVHIGDTAALCGDVAYQIGQVACEALRTMVINTLQDWCGNRFGKGLIRPGGTSYPLDDKLAGHILSRLTEVNRRFLEVTELIYLNSDLVARFENTGTVTKKQALLAGAVGMAARTSGLHRDIRSSHPFQAYRRLDHQPALLEGGDVLARAMLRKMEFVQSYSVVDELIMYLKLNENRNVHIPDFNISFRPGALCVSLTEGWRGEICHAAVTDSDGMIKKYKIKDPSLHNWLVLALAVREQEISDFPVCNKSFNLSYCGNDL